MNEQLTLLATAAQEGGFFQQVLDFFKVDEPWKIWLILFGLAGQAVFFFRWIIQWIASEKRGESHMPEAFWWCSFVGAGMLFTYFLIDRDIVGLVGQSVGWTVYSRNLYFIKRKKRLERKDEATPSSEQST